MLESKIIQAVHHVNYLIKKFNVDNSQVIRQVRNVRYLLKICNPSYEEVTEVIETNVGDLIVALCGQRNLPHGAHGLIYQYLDDESIMMTNGAHENCFIILAENPTLPRYLMKLILHDHDSDRILSALERNTNCPGYLIDMINMKKVLNQ
jgi:hypothetical protein